MPTEKTDPRRAFPRFKAFIATRARRDGDDFRAHVLDVARGGARLHTETPLAVTDRAMIRLGDREVVGTVVWSRERKSGFRFDAPLTPAEVLRIVEAA